MKHLMKPSRRSLLMITGASCAATVVGVAAHSAVTAQAQTTPQQLPSPQLPSAIDENLLSQPALLEQLRSGSLKPEDAWQSGALNAQNVRALLEKNLGGWTREDRTLRAALAGLLLEHAPQELAPIATLNRSLKRALADLYASRKDERAIPLYEGLAASREYSTYEQGLLLETLGYFERDMNQVKPAMATFMRAREKYVAMKQKHAASGMLIETARLQGTQGETAKAQALYDQAEREGDGWTTGLSRYEQARVLMKSGRHTEARALLQKPLSDQNADQIKVGLLSLLARSYYATGDKANSRRFGEAAIAQYKSLKAPLQGEGMEGFVEAAQEVVEWSGRFNGQTIVCEPGEVVLPSLAPSASALPLPSSTTKGGAVMRQPVVMRQVSVRTPRLVELSVRCEGAGLRARVVKKLVTKQPYYVQQEMIVTIEPAPGAAPATTSSATPQTSIGSVVISSKELPGSETRLPVRRQANGS